MVVGFKQWRGELGDGMERTEKSKNILMFGKKRRNEQNQIWWHKLVIMRAKGDRLESCHALQGRGSSLQLKL